MAKAPKSSKNSGSALCRPSLSSPLPQHPVGPTGPAFQQSLGFLSQSATQASQERLDDDSVASDSVAPLSVTFPTASVTSLSLPSTDPQLLSTATVAERISSPAPATPAKRSLRAKRPRSPARPPAADTSVPAPPSDTTLPSNPTSTAPSRTELPGEAQSTTAQPLHCSAPHVSSISSRWRVHTMLQFAVTTS